MSPDKRISYVVASDVRSRDGIGLETYINGGLAMEIFRDDTEKRTYMTLFCGNIDIGVLEDSIEQFKQRVDPRYIEPPGS